MTSSVRDALQSWVRIFSQVDYDQLFTNGNTARSGRLLCERDGVYPIEVSAGEIAADVFSPEGEATSELIARGDRVHVQCSCGLDPDDLPCAHVAALVYFLCTADAEAVETAVAGIVDWSEGGENWSEGDESLNGRYPLEQSEPPGKPGEELGRHTVSFEDERYPGISREQVSRQFAPMTTSGTVIDETGQAVTYGAGAHAPSRAERDKRYRSVFTLRRDWMRDWNPQFGLESVWGLRPGLLYLRKDGTEGAVGDYSSSKPRIPAGASTERLYRYLLSFDGRTAPAAAALYDVLTGKNLTSEQLNGEKANGHGEPLELYMEGSRAELRVRMQPRPIKMIAVEWRCDRFETQAPSLRPEFRFSADDDGEAEGLSRAVAEGADAFASLLLVPNPESGRLWWLRETPDVVATLQRVLRNSAGITLQAAQRFYAYCREHLSHLLEIATPPEQLTVVDLVPIPILHFDRNRIGGCVVTLAFRYWNTEVPLTGDGGEVSWIEGAGPWEFCRRNRSVELRFRNAATGELRRAVAELSETQAGTWNPRARSNATAWFVDRSYSLYEDTEAFEPLELLLVCAERLLASGFELRYRGQAVRTAEGTPSYRVRPSGEGWFEAELGLSGEEGFVPLDHVPHRGSAVANGRLYILSTQKDLDRIRDLGVRVRFDEHDLATLSQVEELADDPEDEAFERLRTLRERIAEFDSIEQVAPPEALGCELRPYQREGLSWLHFLHRYSLGGCLADDMGLGKTIQALAALLLARHNGEMRRALVVAPVSTLGNWARESAAVAPEFSVTIHAGGARAKDPEAFSPLDIVLVSYATLRRDINLFQQTAFDYLVLDEAQAVKNPRSKTRRAIRSLEAPHRLALTGTPIENNTIELWSMFDLLSPGMLGPLDRFKRHFARPIEEKDDETARERLQRIIRPLLLRRRKRDVAPELPERDERELVAEPDRKQLQVYESLRRKFKRDVERKVDETGIDGARIHVLEAMLRLRQAAIFPRLVDPEYTGVKSAKLELLEEIVATVYQEGNKVLVFSQFVAVIDEVEERLSQHTDSPSRFRIDGSTPHARRQSQIAGFQSATGSALFLISLRAGGFGINLTAADYVVLLDPWWNPAVEAQAIDRAHRIGRDGTVIAYRLITKGTIEEKMLRLQERKRDLAESIIHADQNGLKGLSREDLEWLFT